MCAFFCYFGCMPNPKKVLGKAGAEDSLTRDIDEKRVVLLSALCTCYNAPPAF